MISHKTVLCLGSNCGDRKKTLENALTVIRSIAESVKASEMYETPAVADASSTAFAKHPYVNMVVEAETSLTLHDLGIKITHSRFSESDLSSSNIDFQTVQHPLHPLTSPYFDARKSISFWQYGIFLLTLQIDNVIQNSTDA